jgi:hypothetical protein
LPVDFSPEPLSFDFEKYLGWFDRVLYRKKIKTFNLVMHSWSLLRRDGDYFVNYAPNHEERLKVICEHLISNTEVRGYSEYLLSDKVELNPGQIVYFNFDTAKLSEEQALRRCNICSAVFVPRETDVCPGCSGRARHRQIVDALSKVGNPFDNKSVLACFANTVEKYSILKSAKEIRNFDIRPVSEVDYQMDIQQMDTISDESFDGFVAIHVLNHVRDDRRALKEIYRILKPGGVSLITVHYRIGEPTTELSNIYEHYGKENFERYGVGSFRRYGLDDIIYLLSECFDVITVDGYDPVTSQNMKVFLLRKPSALP